MSADLPALVRSEALGRVARQEAFTPREIAQAVGLEDSAAAVAQVARELRRLFDQGLFRRFGYRRTLRTDRTRSGMVSAVLYAPAAVTRPPVPSSAPTRAPLPIRLPQRITRRLERQAAALGAHIERSSADLIRIGELLDAARSVLGRERWGRWVERELGMSLDTARRYRRVARIFSGHPALARLLVLRPSALYVLSAASFPSDLRERIIRRGLTVEGRDRPLETLSRRELLAAARAHHGRGTRPRRRGELARAAAALLSAHAAGKIDADELRAKLKELTGD
jgi:hypothetical protein